MAFLSPGVARSVRHTTAALLTFAAGALAACSDKAPPTPVAPKPVLPGNGGPANPYRGSAFQFDVDTRAGKVDVKSPQQTGVTNGPSTGKSAAAGANLSKTPTSGGPSLSIVAGDVVEVTATNYRVCGLTVACGATDPAPPAGMQLVQFIV